MVHVNGSDMAGSAEIVYFVSAYVVRSRPRIEGTAFFSVCADKPSVAPVDRFSNPVSVPQKEFNIRSNLLWKQGKMWLGIDMDSDLATHGSVVPVNVTYKNCSKVAIKDFTVRWIERVTLSTKGDDVGLESNQVKFDRVLAEDKVVANAGYTEQKSVQLLLPLPMDGYETYSGALFQVEHEVCVIMATAYGQRILNSGQKFA